MTTAREGSRPNSAYTTEKMMVADGASRKSGSGDDSGSDAEKGSCQVERKLKSRHLQMIAIGTYLSSFSFPPRNNL